MVMLNISSQTAAAISHFKSFGISENTVFSNAIDSVSFGKLTLHIGHFEKQD
jgi:hypothetical protein